MKTQYYVLSSVLTGFIIIALFVITLPVKVFSTEKFTDTDAETLKSGDPDAVSEVLYKLMKIYDAEGKEGLKPAVPLLIESTMRELKIPEDERWNLVDFIKIVSMTGDERVKPLLLHIMSVVWGGGNPFVAQGFLAIGSSVVPDITDSLKSTSSDTKGRAAVTLHKMYQFDESDSFFTEENRKMIKESLVDNLTEEGPNVRIFTVVALQSFGDASVIKPLEYIKKHDAHKDSGGTYEVRIAATETLSKLKP